MKRKREQNGITLTELVVVVAVIAILLGISIPTARQIIQSLEHSAGAVGLIDAALASARAMAVSENRPVGVRFQQDTKGDFYMIFILHDPELIPFGSGLDHGFRAYPNRRPMKLPTDIGVLEGTLTADHEDSELDTDPELYDKQTFSIVFSEKGQIIQFPVHVWNRDGAADNSSSDPIFNTTANVDSGTGMFYQDDDAAAGRWRESSIHSFYICQKEQLQETAVNQRFTSYIQNLQKEFVNPYTGQLIKN